ncbi:MAG: DJ-1/PfpI family protein [Patescibacteria group bacterium]
MRFVILLILLSSLSLIGAACLKKEAPIMKPEEKILDKQVLIVIAFQGFQDLEYSKTREILEKAGAKVVVASSSLGKASGKFGAQTKVEVLINEIKIDDYEAIIFIGGPGAVEYIENQAAHRLAKEAIKADKVVAAICIAPAILAKAGVLSGKKATVWSSIFDQEPIKILQENGAQYLDQDVVVDGKIITANGPNAAEKFGQAIVEQLR